MRIFLTFIFITLFSFDKILSQCAMCKGAAETSLETGNAQAAGINAGVLYVIVIVFTILSAFAFMVWKYRNADGLYK